MKSAPPSRWAGLSSATVRLLTAAELDFEVLLTTDRHLRDQQNLVGRRIAILVLPTTSWPRLQGLGDRIRKELEALKPGTYREMPL